MYNYYKYFTSQLGDCKNEPAMGFIPINKQIQYQISKDCHFLLSHLLFRLLLKHFQSCTLSFDPWRYCYYSYLASAVKLKRDNVVSYYTIDTF